MSEPSATVAIYGRQSTLPRFNDELTRASARVGAVQLVWDRASVTATLWFANASELGLSVPLDSQAPNVGEILEVSARLGFREFKCVVVVEQLSEVYGSFKLISCRMRSASGAVSRGIQRRANVRFAFSPLFPLFCFARNPLDGSTLPLRAVDVSNGGVSLIGPASETVPLIGLELPCRFDAPSLGSFSATLILRHVDSSNTNAQLRASAEFTSLSTHARDVIASCLTRPMSFNSIGELKREHLLSKSWAQLVDFSSLPVEGDSPECIQPDLTLIGRLADELVCKYTVTRSNGFDCVITGGPTVPELDPADLQQSALNAIALHRKSLGFSHDTLQKLGPLRARDTRGPILNSMTSSRRERSKRIYQIRRTTDSATTKTANGGARSQVRWDEYAEAYDVMCSANPAYAENLEIFREWIDELRLPLDAKICDVGAGTGNYVLEFATRFPQSHIIHLDSDPMMNRAASRKYRAQGATNVAFATSDASSASFDDASLDIIVCVNALYTFDSAEQALKKFNAWLKPTGLLFLIDLGRPMDVADWSRFIIASSVKRVGIAATARAFLRGRKAIGQNRLIRREQQQGRYWLHTSDEFAASLQRAGFDITHARTCYRNVCDLAICRRSH